MNNFLNFRLDVDTTFKSVDLFTQNSMNKLLELLTHSLIYLEQYSEKLKTPFGNSIVDISISNQNVSNSKSPITLVVHFANPEADDTDEYNNEKFINGYKDNPSLIDELYNHIEKSIQQFNSNLSISVPTNTPFVIKSNGRILIPVLPGSQVSDIVWKKFELISPDPNKFLENLKY